MENRCCALGEVEAENIKKGVELLNAHRSGGFYCIFAEYFSEAQELYKYKERFYCILHLPLSGKKVHNLDNKVIQECLNNLIEKNCSNFNFVSLEAIGIVLNRCNNFYSFIGAHLKNLSLSGSLEQGSVHLDFSASLIEGDRNSIYVPFMHRCDFLRSTLHDLLIIRDCKIDNINFRQAEIFGARYISNEFGVYIKNSTIKDFILTDSLVHSFLCFEDSILNNLYIKNSKFLIPPSIYKCDIKRLTLPKKNDYIDITRSSDRRGVKKEIAENVLDYQYKNFRDLYNILKEKGMRNEMDDYYYMKKKCFEKKTSENKWIIFASRFYRWSSDYGQDIKKPVLGMFVLIISFFFLNLMFMNSNQAFQLSFNNIISPFFLFKTENFCKTIENFSLMDSSQYVLQRCGKVNPILYFFSLIESLLSLGLIAVFLISLRWNFKKE